MSQYARQAKSSWAECAICGFDFPQIEMVRHYKFGVLVDLACADELAHSDYMESLRLPENERPYPTQQRVPDQGTVTEDYGFFFDSTSLDTGKLRMTAGPVVRQGPQ
jgi:hypothetical protein